MARVDPTDHPPLYAYWILQASLPGDNVSVVAVDRDEGNDTYKVLIAANGSFVLLRDPINKFPSKQLISQILLYTE